jgi:hypothetical protein
VPAATAGPTVLTAPIPRSSPWSNIATRLECEAEEDDEAAQQGLAHSASSAASAATRFDDHDNDDDEVTEEWILVTRAPTPSESELSMIVHWAASGASSMKSGANSALASSASYSSFSASSASATAASHASPGGVGTNIDGLASASGTSSGGSGRKTSSARKRHHMVANLDSSAASNEAGAPESENVNVAASSHKHSGERHAKSRAVMANGLNEDGSESEHENGTGGEETNGASAAAGASASDLDSDGYGSELAFLINKQMSVRETSSQNMPYMM